jgi:hypothetical protein
MVRLVLSTVASLRLPRRLASSPAQGECRVTEDDSLGFCGGGLVDSSHASRAFNEFRIISLKILRIIVEHLSELPSAAIRTGRCEISVRFCRFFVRR